MSEINNKITNQIVENFLTVIGRDFAELGGSWPLTAAQLKGYFHHLFYLRLYKKYLESPAQFKEALATLPITVLRIYTLRDSILAFKLARKYYEFNITQNEIINFFLTVSEVIGKKTEGNHFSLNRELILWNSEEQKKYYQGEWLILADREQRRLVSDFSISLQAYLWSIQYDVCLYGLYWHGPYQVENKTYLVKEFFDLNLPFWTKCLYQKVKIIYAFEGKISLGIDAGGNLNYESNPWEKLNEVKIFVDERELKSINEIKKLDDYFNDLRGKQVAKVEKLKPLEIINYGILIYHHMYKSFFDYYHETWRPENEISKRVKEQGLYYWKRFKGSDEKRDMEETRNFLQNLYDPRNEYTG